MTSRRSARWRKRPRPAWLHKPLAAQPRRFRGSGPGRDGIAIHPHVGKGQCLFPTFVSGSRMNDSTLTIEPLLAQVAAADTLEALESARVALLGKSGAVTEQLKLLGKLPPEQRKAQGERINVVKERLQDA